MRDRLFALLFVLCIPFLISGCSGVKGKDVPVDESLSFVKEKGTISIGMDLPYGFMEFYDENGEFAGLEVDVAREIASRLGVSANIIDYDWDDIFIDIKSGELDIAITSMTITPKRSQGMLFSDPYFNAGQTIVTKRDSSITLPEDLAGKRVGAQKETTSLEEAIKHTGDESLVVAYDSYEVFPDRGIIYDLKHDKIDAIALDYVAAIGMVNKDSSLKIAGDPFTQEFYGIPTQLGNDTLVGEINNILGEMKKDGTMQKIKDKWSV